MCEWSLSAREPRTNWRLLPVSRTPLAWPLPSSRKTRADNSYIHTLLWYIWYFWYSLRQNGTAHCSRVWAARKYQFNSVSSYYYSKVLKCIKIAFTVFQFNIMTAWYKCRFNEINKRKKNVITHTLQCRGVQSKYTLLNHAIIAC